MSARRSSRSRSKPRSKRDGEGSGSESESAPAPSPAELSSEEDRAPSHSERWNAPRSRDARSRGSAPRTSSSRRRAPFGAARSPTGSPILSGPPACPPGTSATTRPPAARTPPTWSSAARRRRHSAALCRPALLDGAAQPLQAEAGGRVLLVDPLARGVLRGRGADLQAGWPRRELGANTKYVPSFQHPRAR